MENIELEKDLIAILLVVQSVHDKNKLLYKYEEIQTYKPPDEPITFYTPYSNVIAKDFDPPRAKEDDASRKTFLNFDETTLSILTSPYVCDIHTEVQVDDVILAGHTLGLENNENLKSFAIFFALRAIAKTSVLRSYQEISKRIGTAIRCEEQRASYLNREYATLMNILQQHELDFIDPCRMPGDGLTKERENVRTKEALYAEMASQSTLAAILKKIYKDLRMSGEINLIINDWINVSCCLPHRSVPINCPFDTDFVVDVLSHAEDYLKPYYGLLLIIDPMTLLDSLPPDGSSTLTTLVRNLNSFHSLASLALETNIPLSQIYRLAAHLIYWGRAKVIYPINDDNIYIISHDADISKHGSLSKMYQEKFQSTSSNHPTLQQTLAEYSDAITFYDHTSHFNNEDEKTNQYIQCVEWLLQHRLLTQVHNYYYLLLPNDIRHDFTEEYKRTRLNPSNAQLTRLVSEMAKSSSSQIGSSLAGLSTHGSKSTNTLRTLGDTFADDVFASSSLTSNTPAWNNRKRDHFLHLIAQMMPNERSDFRGSLALAIQDAKEQYVVDFLKIIKYFDGTHHVDEIAALENIKRSYILTLIEHFQSIIVSALHEDPNPLLRM